MPKERDHTIVVVTDPVGDPEQHRAVTKLFEVSAKEERERQNRRRALKKSRPYKKKQDRAKKNKLIALKIDSGLPPTTAKINRALRVRDRWPDKDAPSLRQIYRYFKTK
jgi:hypothetical protein